MRKGPEAAEGWARRTIVKRGARGPFVVQLQNALRRRGYDPGPSDGRFGLLTEDAVRRLQEDYGLRVDGRIGPEVYRVLFSPRPLPVARRPVPERPVLERSSGGGVAHHEGASVWAGSAFREKEALTRWLLLGAAPPALGSLGQRVVEWYGLRVTGIVDSRFQPADAAEGAAAAAQTEATDKAAAELLGSGADLRGAGLPERLPWPSGASGWVAWPFPTEVARLSRRGALGRGSARRGDSLAARVEAAAAWAKGQQDVDVRGFHLVRPRLPWGQGHRWARGVRALSDRLWRHRLTLLVTLSPADVGRVPRRLLGDMHLEEWVPFVEGVIVPAPDIGQPDPFLPWYSRLAAARPLLPLWKCVIDLDMRAVMRDEEGHVIARLSHGQLLALCHRRGVRLRLDDATGCRRAVYEEEGRRRELCHWTADLLALWVERASLWGFAGVKMGPAGTEDERLWNTAFRLLPVARHAEPVPGIRFHEREGGVVL